MKETISAEAQKVDVSAPRERVRGQRPNTCNGTPPRCTWQSGRPHRGLETVVADLVGLIQKEKRQQTPQACTALKAN